MAVCTSVWRLGHRTVRRTVQWAQRALRDTAVNEASAVRRLTAVAGLGLGVSAAGAAASGGGSAAAACDGDRSQIFSGHASGIRFEGGKVLKRLQDEGRGSREAAILALLSQSPAWQPFVPEFHGLLTDAEGHTWVSMGSLTAGMRRPVILDLKVGTRHWSPGEKEKKKRKEMKKAATTTIGTLGLRIVGCRIPGEDYGDTGAENWGYKDGRDASAEELGEVLRRYLRSEGRTATARRFAAALLALFRFQDEYVFLGSSLLMAYDADLGDEAPLRVAMIDFGHVHTMAELREEAESEGLAVPERRDVGYIKGLSSLLDLLGGEGLASMELDLAL